MCYVSPSCLYTNWVIRDERMNDGSKNHTDVIMRKLYSINVVSC